MPVTKPQGIDVSHYQGEIDWAAVAAAGISFAYIKASEGSSIVDPRFAENWREAKAAGILRGAYHFFRPGVDPRAQVDLFDRTMGDLGLGDLQPAVDVEATDNVPPPVYIAQLRTFVQGLRAACGRDPVVYASPAFWRERLQNTPLFAGASPLWVAHWTSAPSPAVMGGWSVWTFWQYSATGAVAGVHGAVDRNKFNGPYAALLKLAGCGGG